MMKLPEGSPIWNMVKNHDKNNNSTFFKTVFRNLKLSSLIVNCVGNYIIKLLKIYVEFGSGFQVDFLVAYL